MKQRVVTAAIFTPAVLALLLLHPVLAHGTLVLIALGVLRELKAMFTRIDLQLFMPGLLLLYGVCLAAPWSIRAVYPLGEVLLEPYLIELGAVYGAAFALFFIILLIVAILRFPAFGIGDIGVNLLAALYPLPMLVGAIGLCYLEPSWLQGRMIMLLILVLTWAYDTAAFLGGSYYGKHHPFPELSPKKSIEGILFGLCGAILAGLIYNRVLGQFSLTQILFLSIAAGTLAQLGDLVASMLKRFCGVKDSGTLFPGHGGVLDRFDAFFFVSLGFTVFYAVIRR